jgi:hypothetical protein
MHNSCALDVCKSKDHLVDHLTHQREEKRGRGGGEEEKSPTNILFFNVFILKLLLFEVMIETCGFSEQLHWCSVCDPPKSCWMMKSENMSVWLNKMVLA